MIVRFSSLGDVILTTPLIKELKNKNPNAEIDFLLKPQFKAAIATNSSISNVYEFEKSKNYDVLLNRLSRKKYDLIIDLQNNFRSRRITSKLSVKTYRFNKPTLKKIFLVHFKWNLFKKLKTIPEMYIESIPGLQFHNYLPKIDIPKDIVPSIKPNKYIGFAPGSKHFTKMWPAENFIELGKLFSKEGYTILIFGGSDDKDLCSSIHQAIPNSIDLSTDNNLLQMARDFKECTAIVCNDSGLMHTAVAVDIPVVALFGSTVKEFGFYPYSNKSLVIENNELNCRPCSHIGKDKCPKKHFKCLLELSPELVFNKSLNFLKTV